MLLDEGVKKQKVIGTDYSRKITLDGFTQSYQVYKIRLDQLYFNDQNDRIATWISKYKTENNIEKINSKSPEYNDVIEQFVYKSNPKAIEKTKNNISLVGQREAGVVLSDGRIIDGNRRFTCLRKIEKETLEPQYFEAVILNRDIQSDEKAIKLLELSIQHGEEGKVDYNPIDRLVGIYNDIVKNKLISIDEYSKTVNETKASIQKKVEQALLMVEFLEFINAPEQFFIARDLELDGPLIEIQLILKKATTEEKLNDLKLILFNIIIMKPQGDISRFVRKMKPIVDSEHHEDFIEEQLNFVEHLATKLENAPNVDTQFINRFLRTDDELKDTLSASVEKFERKAKKDSSRNKPINDLTNCKTYLEGLDLRIVNTFTSIEKQEFENLLQNCQQLLNQIMQGFKGV